MCLCYTTELLLVVNQLVLCFDRLTIIGVLLSFRHMLQEVLYDSMTDHAPFLMSSIKDFSDNVPGGSNEIYINEMAASAGEATLIGITLILYLTLCVISI